MKQTLAQHIAKVLVTNWWKHLDVAGKTHYLRRWAYHGRNNNVVRALVAEEWAKRSTSSAG